MADSIPSLRRKLNEANAEIEKLRGLIGPPNEVIKEVFVDRIVNVEVIKEVPVVHRVEHEKIVYVENPEHVATIKALQERLAQCQKQ